MRWPDVDPRRSFPEIEEELGIVAEVDDILPEDLGQHPSESYYRYAEEETDLGRMRRKFDRAAKRVEREIAKLT